MIEIKKQASSYILHKRVSFSNLDNSQLVSNYRTLIPAQPNKIICPIQFVVYYFSYTDNLDYNINAGDGVTYAGNLSYILLYYNIGADQTGYKNVLAVDQSPSNNLTSAVNSPIILSAYQVSGGIPTTILNLDLTIDIYYTLNDPT